MQVQRSCRQIADKAVRWWRLSRGHITKTRGKRKRQADPEIAPKPAQGPLVLTIVSM
jgi:hypothetical protein